MLGLIEVAGEDEAAARDHLERARGWVSISGEVEMALRCAELEARIELAAGRLLEAARSSAEGIRISEACGFRLFQMRFAVIAARCEIAKNPRRAAEDLVRALSAAAPDDAWGRADATHWAGVAWGNSGDRERATAMLKEALAFRQRLTHPETSATKKALAAQSRRRH
jgi:cell division septum initiation protein DivIVA